MVKEEKKNQGKRGSPQIWHILCNFPILPFTQPSLQPEWTTPSFSTCHKHLPCPRPSHTWMPISVKLNFFPEAFPVYSVRTTCFSKLLISNMYFSAPHFMLSLPLVNSGFLPWGTLIHYKLSMNWIYVHFFSGSFQVLGRYLLLSEIPGKHMVNKNVYFHQSANSTPLPRLHVPTVLDLLTHEFPDRSESWQLNHRQ